jgi:hypothetical protein
MVRELITRLLSIHRVLVLTLGLSAAAGWVSYAVSRQSSAGLEGQLRRELASLQDTQTKLLSEQLKTRVSLSEMAQLRADLAAARIEIARLSSPIGQAKESPNTIATSDNVSNTGSIVRKATKPLPVKAVSGDKPSPSNSNGQPEVRIAAPVEQKVIERSRRSARLAPAPDLDTASLRQLTKSAEAPAQ